MFTEQVGFIHPCQVKMVYFEHRKSIPKFFSNFVTYIPERVPVSNGSVVRVLYFSHKILCSTAKTIA